MATMTIRDVDEHVKQRLRARAAAHGRSVEDEVRDILRVALAAGENDHRSLVEAIRARFAPLGGVELHIPPREAIRTVPGFADCGLAVINPWR